MCLTICDPLHCSLPGFSVLHYFLQFAQTHVHLVGDAIQPSHPLFFPSPLAFHLSQHQVTGTCCQTFLKLLPSLSVCLSPVIILYGTLSASLPSSPLFFQCWDFIPRSLISTHTYNSNWTCYMLGVCKVCSNFDLMLSLPLTVTSSLKIYIYLLF